MRDTVFHRDIYDDLFITHGGLFSKRVIRHVLESQISFAEADWQLVKQHALDAIHTHDEVSERQPILIELFQKLRLGQDITKLRAEGDMLLRDFVVEVKQPSFLRNASTESATSEANDQQLLRAMRKRRKKWGILTNGADWQFVYEAEEEHSSLAIPFMSFSVLDMAKDEKSAKQQIALFLGILTNRELRHFLVKKTDDARRHAVKSYTQTLREIIKASESLGIQTSEINQIIKFTFKLSFLFYAEDIGALPRNSRHYQKFDVRRAFARSLGSFPLETVADALGAFADQRWSSIKVEDSGNAEFWSEDLAAWIKRRSKIFKQVSLHRLWLDAEFHELDLSELSSADLCDAYQNCVFHDSEQVGTVYTNAVLSSFVNHFFAKNLKTEIGPGDIILDPACGSGHLLKRLLYVAPRLLGASSFKSKADLIEQFCVEHLAGIDINPVATFVAKVNLWLTCLRAGKSLPKLHRIETDNTLKRFEASFSRSDSQLSEFLGELGTRVVGVVSNPPWSMVEKRNGKPHPEEWISRSEYWKSVKKNVAGIKHNTAFNFGYLIDQILDPEGVAVVILPGVFFVGAECLLRDYLSTRIASYLPSSRNEDFESIDPSQNYGVVAFQKKGRKEAPRVYLQEGDKLRSMPLPAEIWKLPQARNAVVDDVFPTDTILPLFSSASQIEVMRRLIEETVPVKHTWTKGKDGLPLKGEGIAELASRPWRGSGTAYIIAPENNGNPKEKILKCKTVAKADYDRGNHKVMKYEVAPATQEEYRGLISYFSSDSLDQCLSTLRTSKSIVVATLNMLGIPKDVERWTDIVGRDDIDSVA